MNNVLPLFILSGLFGCAGNNPPRFKEVNGKKVQYIFGVAILDVFDLLSGSNFLVEPEEVFDIHIEVTDSNGDDIELLFPNAPKGWTFDKNERDGFWEVPSDPINFYQNIEVLAIDEQGASDVLHMVFAIETNDWDSGYYEEASYISISGTANTENHFNGQLTLEYSNWVCELKLEWLVAEGTALNSCQNCEIAWEIQRVQQSDLQVLYNYPPYCDAMQRQIEELEHLRLGWSPSLIHEGIEYSNTLLIQIDDGNWVPNGTGTLQSHRLTFNDVRIYSE